MRGRRLWVPLRVGLLAWLLASCASSKTEAPATDPVSATTHRDNSSLPEAPLSRSLGYRPPPQAADSDATWLTAHLVPHALRGQGLVVSLPDPEGWKSLGARGGFSGLAHESTGSELWVQHKPARRTVSLRECEQTSRASFSALRDTYEVTSERHFASPEGYGGVARLILLDSGGGRVEAFAVGVSRCLAFLFTAEAKPGFPTRLEVVRSQVLDALRMPYLGERGVGKSSAAPQ